MKEMMTLETRKKIQRYANAGLDPGAISQVTGIHAATVALELRRSPHPYNAEEAQALADERHEESSAKKRKSHPALAFDSDTLEYIRLLRTEGKGVRQICVMIKSSYYRVQKALQGMGFEILRKGRPPGFPNKNGPMSKAKESIASLEGRVGSLEQQLIQLMQILEKRLKS